MKKILLFFLAFFGLSLFFVSKVRASDDPACRSVYEGYSIRTNASAFSNLWPSYVHGKVDYIGQTEHPIDVSFTGLIPNKDYTFRCVGTQPNQPDWTIDYKNFITNSDGSGSITLSDNKCFASTSFQNWYENDAEGFFVNRAYVELEGSNIKCDDPDYLIRYQSTDEGCGNITVTNTRTGSNDTCSQVGDTFNWTAKLKNAPSTLTFVKLRTEDGDEQFLGSPETDADGNLSGKFTINESNLGERFSFSISTMFVEGVCKKELGIKRPVCSSTPEPNTNTGDTLFELCNQIPKPPAAQGAEDKFKQQREDCMACAGPDKGKAAGIWTAVGCIPTSKEGIVGSIMTIGLSISGGVSLLLILAGAFLITSSQGDMKRVTQGKEMVTSAIVGLLFVIFSVTVLRFIGVNLLRIPGFGQ